MTPKACPLYPQEPSLIREFREEYSQLADLFGSYRVPGASKILQKSEGVDVKYRKMMVERLQAMWAVPLDRVFEHLNGKVFYIRDKKGVPVPTRKSLEPDEQGVWLVFLLITCTAKQRASGRWLRILLLLLVRLKVA